jgi:hypothetical protein
LLQNKLLAQLAEMSYQAVNGTRQAPRNFREGTLEIGKMNFTTPQDRITKEMIMDYQKSEQEKHYTDSAGNKLLYEPTGLSDVIDVYNPINSGLLGAPATEDDVRNYEDDLLQLHYDLNALKADAKTKDEEVSDKKAEIFKKGEQVQNKKDEHTATQKNWRELNVELKEVQDRITKIEAVLAAPAAALSAGTAPPSPVPGATPETVAKGKIKEKELEDDIKVVDAKLLALQAEITTIEKEKLQIDTSD